MTEGATPLVYVVDDDRLVTESLGTALRVETDWRVLAFNEAQAALAAMAGAPPDVVLSDLKMPRMDGLAFLKRVRLAHPRAVLLLLTGYADKESAIAAINEVGIWQYIEKPWDTGDLLVKVRQGLERQGLYEDRRRLTGALEQRNAELAGRLGELEAAQDRLVASERLAAVGRVASGVAHELGNQLALIGSAEAIAARTTDPQIAELARTIVAAQRRLASMIDEIKDFARSPAGGPGAAYARTAEDLGGVVTEALSLLRWDRDVRARTITPELRARPLVSLHRGKLIQVVINLVRNAAQASPEHCPVVVSVDEEGGEAVLRVTDRGGGMDAATLGRLGEPFFTTKEGGSGLGLGISRRIVDEHGGRLDVRSRLGEGTEVTVRLPLAAPPAGR